MKGNRVVLLPTFQDVHNYRKSQASQSQQGFFGIWVTTPYEFLNEAWEVWGTEQHIVGTNERLLVLAKLVKASNFFEFTPGTVQELAKGIQAFFGTEAYAGIRGNSFSVSPSTSEILKIFEAYHVELQQLNLIEPGDALSWLKNVMPSFSFTLPKKIEVSQAFQEFLLHINPEEITRLSSCDSFVFDLPENKNAEFIFSTGASAKNVLILDTLLSKQKKLNLIVSPHPEKLYNALSYELGAHGFSSMLLTHKMFNQTYFGAAYRACYSLLFDGESYTALSDYLYSPYADVEERKAQEVDVALNQNPELTTEQLRSLAQQCSPSFSFLEELFSVPDASVLFDYFTDLAKTKFKARPADLQDELRAISILRSVYEAARNLHVSHVDFNFLLNTLSFYSHRTTVEQSDFQVVFCDAQQALRYQPDSFDLVMMTDLDSQTYTLNAEEVCFEQFCRELNLSFKHCKKEHLRYLMKHAQRCTRDVFACEQVLTHENGDEAYPCFFFDEFMSLYRSDEDTLLPFGLDSSQASVRIQGEDTLLKNALSQNHTYHAIDYAQQGLLNKKYTPLVLLKRYLSDTGSFEVTLSPSSIEAYLACPYRWFTERRINPVDAYRKQGALEQGSFVHTVYQSFYDKFNDVFHEDRITEKTLADAQMLFSKVFDEVLAQQDATQDNAYLIRTHLEKLESIRLKQQLLKTLEWQARLLPTYHVSYQEFSFGTERLATYGGAYMTGRVDRIDVDPNQQTYVVIDYKGSINNYHAGFDGKIRSNGDPSSDKKNTDSFELPHKVQALIYAQLLRKELKTLHPAGAIYFGYKSREAKHCIAGSFNAATCDVREFSSSKSQVLFNFEIFLDNVEQALIPYLQNMQAGNIAPCPRSSQVCQFCPARYCERKR